MCAELIPSCMKICRKRSCYKCRKSSWYTGAGRASVEFPEELEVAAIAIRKAPKRKKYVNRQNILKPNKQALCHSNVNN